MWPALTILAVAVAAGIVFYWRKRCEELFAEAERTRAEAARVQGEQRELLARAEARQAAFFDSIIEGVLVLDRDGRVQAANEALRRFFRIDRDVRGQTLLEAFRLNELVELRERVLREREVRDFELEVDGLRDRSFEVGASTLAAPNGASEGMVFVFHDVTRLKQLENTRKEFVANVSHELRTPLTMIKGFVETLLSGAKDNPEVATRFLQTIDRHTDRLTFLIEDLLTISRLESGQIVLNSQPLELRPLVERVREELAARANERGVTVLNEIAAGLTAMADADRLQQVILNLVDNAIKYGGEKGAVIVGASPAGNDRIRIWVKDNGPGIPPESLGRVFERFYRVDRARSREQGGTGLGLAIVKHIVQSHGGEVWAESEPGAGATFSFTLPRA